MKKTGKNVIVLLLIMFAQSVFTQWSPDIRLTNNTGNSYTSLNNARNIAASGQVLHTVWEDSRFGNYEIMYKRSTDGGTNWEAVVRLTNSNGSSNVPSVSVSGQTVHVVWQDDRDGNNEIYYKRSTDAGVTWGSDQRFTTNSAYSLFPSMDVFGAFVQVTWQDDRDGNNEIYYKRSTDAGFSWEPVVRLTNNSGASYYPSIFTAGIITHIVWQDDRDGNKEIYYNRSINAGVSWSTDTRLTSNTGESSYPCLSVSGTVIHIVWSDNRDGNYEIYYRRSPDNGLNWDAAQRLTNNTAFSLYPSITSSGQYLHLIWTDARSGNFGIYYNASTNAGLSWASDLKLNSGNAEARGPSVTYSGNTIHTVWYDYRDSDYEIYYKNNPTGNPTGINSISSDIPERFSLSQNYPNPFNPTTNFEFRIADYGFVNLEIYDALGRKAETLVNGEMNPGTYKTEWDALGYNSGVYFYRLTAGSFTQTKKMILVK